MIYRATALNSSANLILLLRGIEDMPCFPEWMVVRMVEAVVVVASFHLPAHSNAGLVFLFCLRKWEGILWFLPKFEGNVEYFWWGRETGRSY